MTDSGKIAKFMGVETKTYTDTPTIVHYDYGGFMLNEEDLKYDSSWDWLMPVVEKIKNIGMGRPNSMSVHVRRRLLDLSIGTPIKEVYDVVLTFIDWYETQNA